MHKAQAQSATNYKDTECQNISLFIYLLDIFLFVGNYLMAKCSLSTLALRDIHNKFVNYLNRDEKYNKKYLYTLHLRYF